ncbi:MAG: porin [Roseomonas sp.]|nr:porin [Roseomonas sp.]
MRKILLGTTGVVGAALIGMGAAQAQEAPTVRVGGFMQVMYNWVDDDADSGRAPAGVAGAGTVDRNQGDFRNELEIHVFVTGKAANGLSYGAVIELQNDGFGGGAGGGIDTDEAYMFVSSPTLGTLRFGDEDNAASIMQVRVPSITGFGPDGDWDDNILSVANALTSTGPSLLTGINDGNDSTKIIYLSPQFFGFDFGLSYAPTGRSGAEGERAWTGRTVDVATATTFSSNPNLQRDPLGLDNEISAALRYRGTFGGVGIAAGFGYQQSDGASATAAGARASGRDINAYTVGLNLSAFGLTVGGEYTWGEYTGVSAGRASLADGRDDSQHFVLGATYVMGAVSVGVFYGVAEQDNGTINGVTRTDREQTVWGLGVAYTVAPGLEVFGNYTMMEDTGILLSTADTTTVSRDANVFLVGTRLAF